MNWRKIVYSYLYEPLYSVWYSARQIGNDAVDLAKELKRPNTWSAILYVACFYAFMKRDLTLFTWLIPAIVFVYVYRQRVDGRYRGELKKKAFLNNDKIVLEEEYEKYKRECHFTKQVALDYTQWVETEKRKLETDTA